MVKKGKIKSKQIRSHFAINLKESLSSTSKCKYTLLSNDLAATVNKYLQLCDAETFSWHISAYSVVDY